MIARAAQGKDEPQFDPKRQAELQALKVDSLRAICENRSLQVSGKKAELVRRILEQEARWAEEEAQRREEESARAYMSPTDRFMKALEEDKVDQTSLEEIFNMQVPAPGEIVKARVVSLVAWGAFCELEDSGWSGLLHISEISDEFVDNIEDHLHPGQILEVMVIRSPTDRLDRLALSLRRLASPAMRAALAGGDTSSVEAQLARVATSPALSAARPLSTEAIRKIEVRLNAIEAVLIQLGHAETLRNAQSEAHDSRRFSSTPPLEAMLSGIPPPGEERPEVLSVKEAEKLAIDKVLADLEASIPPLEGSEDVLDDDDAYFSAPMPKENGKPDRRTRSVAR